MTRIVLTAILLSAAFIASPAKALDGVEKTTLNVSGKEYVFPIGDTQRKQDIFFLKKALNGDSEAMDMFLGLDNKRLFYIGDEKPVWLSVTKEKTEVL